MKKLSLIWLALMFVVSGSVRAQDVRYNFDKNSDFSKFKTYKWVAIKDATPVDDITDKQIKAALDAELAAKGLSKVDGDNADLFVGYQTAIGSEKQFTSYNTGWGYGSGWGGGWYGGAGGMTTGQTSTIKTLDPKATPDKRQKNLQKSVAKLIKNYPPKTK